MTGRNSIWQGLFLQSYRSVARSQLLHTRVGRFAFQYAYEAYKLGIEAPGTRYLRRLVPPGATVIDIGANIGFFTLRFARWVGASGRVLAIEPSVDNVAWLERRLQARGLRGRVEVFAAAADMKTGVSRLALNPVHPGDHRISDQGVAIQTVTVDQLTEATMPPVALIKIDVQGAEMRVLKGAQRTLERFRPALMIEVDDVALRAYGSSAKSLIEALASQGYAPHGFGRRGITARSEQMDVLLRKLSSGYLDLIFLPTHVGGNQS